MKKDYFIGLDVGTDSVGWAATNEDYDILRLKGKTAFGSALFEEAKDAKERRAFRTSGRRLARRKFRIDTLNTLFAPFILPMDSSFFERLKESSFAADDKKDASFIHPLFGNEKEKKFYKEFPTIWHLRAAMITDEERAFSDIRYVYLAIHHILKYRGNFLSSDDKKADEFDENVYDKLNNCVASKLNVDGVIEDQTYKILSTNKFGDIKKILEDKENNNTKKKKAIIALFDSAYKDDIWPYVELFATIVTGGSYDLSKIDESIEDCKVQFNGSYDENEDKIRSYLGDEFTIVEVAKITHDFLELEDILNGQPHLSKAFVSVYEAHKQQLTALKKILITIDKNEGFVSEKDRLYSKVFKEQDNPKNYPAFVQVGTSQKRPAIHDFNAYILGVINPYEEKYFPKDRDFAMIKAFALNDSLFKTIAISSTSVIPHQLHQKELDTILTNAEKRYPQLKEIEEKIKQLFLFRVPYYYGPLSTSPYSNVVFKENAKKETIYPWNIESIVDDGKTRENFMNSLTNSCAYLKSEKQVLPRQSIIFQDYVNLNRLNTIRINGTAISQDVKENVFENCICLRPKTTIAALKKFLIKNYSSVYGKDGVSISGINETDPFDNTTRYALNGAFDCNKDIKAVERIIYLLAVYCDQKADAINAIKSEFPQLNENQVKVIRGTSIKGWSAFSEKLLCGLRVFDDNGVGYTIFELLKETTLSFNEILYSPIYRFKEAIDSQNKAYFGDMSKNEVVQEIIESIPPKMRRATIQATKIIDELVHITGNAPKAICVEVTREAAKKQKGDLTVSRYKELNDFLKSMAKDIDATISSQAKTLQEQLTALKTKNELTRLKGKHLYLYFKQDGFDLYTGKPIDINDVLDNSNKYDWEHIIPRSKIKDDSLDNTILVAREYNQNVKKDYYPVPEQIRCNKDVRRLWDVLHKKKSISDEKYNRLIRDTELTEQELSDFVNAQINVVNQANKTIKDILEFKYPETKIIFSKAEFPHYLREHYEIVKLRDLNDAHHAVDAYLNVVAGTILHSVYGNLRMAKSLEKSGEKVLSYNMTNQLDRVIQEKSLEEKLVKNGYRHDALLTYRRSYSDSQFYDLNIVAAGDKNGLYPVHSSDDRYCNTEKYGGYNSATSEYMVVCKGLSKNKPFAFLQPVPHVVAITKDKKIIEEWITCKISERFEAAQDLHIDLSSPIYNGTVVKIKGARYILTNKNANQVCLRPFTPVYLSKESSSYLKLLSSIKWDEIQNNSEVVDLKEAGLRKESVIVSAEQNFSVLKEMQKVFECIKYSYCTSTQKGIDVIKEVLEKETGISMKEQISALLACIPLLGRNGSDKTPILSSPFLKSRSAIFADDVEIIDESVTGLYSVSRKL